VFLFDVHGTEGALAIVPVDRHQATYIQVSEFTLHGAQAGKLLADLSIPERSRDSQRRSRGGSPRTIALTRSMNAPLPSTQPWHASHHPTAPLMQPEIRRLALFLQAHFLVLYLLAIPQTAT
jgi:hypothetical protein